MLPIASRTAQWLYSPFPILAFVAVASGCSSPTDAGTPREWTIVGGQATVAVAALLPAGVTIEGQEFWFAPTPRSTGVGHGLYYSCPACENLDGQRVLKPGFTRVARLGLRLPDGLVSAGTTSGAAVVTIENHFDFDPIRPAAGVTGSITALFLRSGLSDTLGRLVIDGTTHSLPPGTSFSGFVPLAGGQLSTFDVEFSYISPAGDSVTMSENQWILLRASLDRFRAPSAEFRVSDRPVSATAELDLSELHGLRAEQLDSVKVRVRTESPFALTGATEVMIAAGANVISRSFPHQSAASGDLIIRLDRSELTRLVGGKVMLSIIGPVSTNQPVTVRPATPAAIASTQVSFFGSR